MLHNGFKYFAALATVSLLSAAACSDDETTATTGTPTTTTTTTTTTGGGGGNDLVAQCTEACGTLYDCGLEADGADQLCPGFTGAAAEKSGFVGDDMSGCVQSCIGFPTLMGLINAEDCSTTVDSISGANDDFKDVCENGFSQGGGGAGGAGGAAAGGNGGGGDNGN